MKKIIVSIMMFFLLGGVIVSAGFMPLPVVVHVNPELAGWEVTVTNTHYGDSRTIYTDANGYAVIEWANVGSFNIGDVFSITANGETKNVYYEGRDIKADFTFTDNFPYIPKIIEVPSDCPICPSCQTCEVCASCPEPEVCPESDCPVQDMTAERIIEGIIILIIGMGAYKYGFGIKVYTKKDGTVEVQHKHRGVVGYHNINIYHKINTHKKGELNPKYDSEGKYVS